MKAPSNPSGFTLVELLVVIAIISLLISLLLPTVSKARDLGTRTVCLSKVRGQLTATFAYVEDYKQALMITPPNNGGFIGGLPSSLDLQTWYGNYLTSDATAISGAGVYSNQMRFYLQPALICPNRPSPSIGAPYQTNFFRSPYAYYTGSSADKKITIDNLITAGRAQRANSNGVTGQAIPGNIPALWGDRCNTVDAGNNGGRGETNHAPGSTGPLTDPNYVIQGGNVGNADGAAKWFNYSSVPSINELAFVAPSGAHSGGQTLFPSNLVCIYVDGNSNIVTSGGHAYVALMGASWSPLSWVFP